MIPIGLGRPFAAKPPAGHPYYTALQECGLDDSGAVVRISRNEAQRIG
jgi:hypothetical protein